MSSLVFGFVHLELIPTPASLAALVIVGAWLAGAFHRSGSLLVAVVGHATFNGTVILAATLAT